jgi:glycine/D-amino acid oxidase-like deaminating enzyme
VLLSRTTLEADIGEGNLAKVVIIGGGVIGSSIAYYLAQAGYARDVVVVEPDPTYEFAATPRATGGIRQLYTVGTRISNMAAS